LSQEEVKQESPWRRFFKGLWMTIAVFGRVFRILLLVVLVLGVLVGITYTMQLDEVVKDQFEGRRWELPARVFARPLEMFEGQQLLSLIHI
jgi:penicillin-binding protein 1B